MGEHHDGIMNHLHSYKHTNLPLPAPPAMLLLSVVQRFPAISQSPIKHHFSQHKQGRIESSISHIFFSNNHDSTWLAAWLRFWVVIRFGVNYEWVLSRCYAHVKQVSRSNARHTWLDFRAAAVACASAADFSSVACCRPAESIEQTE